MNTKIYEDSISPINLIASIDIEHFPSTGDRIEINIKSYIVEERIFELMPTDTVLNIIVSRIGV
jgi:hypothetical protein